MGNDVVLVLLGMWIHQAIRVGVMFLFPPPSLAKATQSDRLKVAGIGMREWSDTLSEVDRQSLESLRRRFFWNFYVLLLVPMICFLAWLLLSPP